MTLFTEHSVLPEKILEFSMLILKIEKERDVKLMQKTIARINYLAQKQ